MRHHNSVMHGLLKQVPWGLFDRLVERHGTDTRARRLTSKSQFIAMLYAQVAGSASLREIETVLHSHSAKLYHLGARPISRSTLADANADRPHQLFSDLFAHMVAGSAKGVRRATSEAVRLIDSTGLRLAGVAAEWARYSKGVCGAKAHIIYDPDADRPLYLDVTPARVNDITAAKAMPIEPGATYVFDLGYYDFGWWAELAAADCRIVTRLKANTPIACTQERALPQGSDLVFDRIGHLPNQQKGTRQNPFRALVREIGVRLDDGRTMRVVTNDLVAPAQEIADLYKRRWAIELFFRWVKQTLKIKHFLGTSENAVRIQIAVALIAYLLLRQLHKVFETSLSILAFTRLVRANLFQRCNLEQLLKPPPNTNQTQKQLSFKLLAA